MAPKKSQPVSWTDVVVSLEGSKKALTAYNRNNRCLVESAIAEKTEQLRLLQEDEGLPDLTELSLLQTEVAQLEEHQDLKWRQLAKEHWLKNGDKNTSYFHACVKQRRRANQISTIIDEGGTVCSTPDSVEEAFLNYFRNIFSTSTPSGLEYCLEGFPRQVTDLMNEQLLKVPTAEEFGSALAQMAPLKAPGPDGFPACFFIDNWALVGTEVCKASFAFFNSCILDESVNFTHIALVPKKPNATKVTDFRPISLCNVGYKIISKVLANRLKIILPKIISHNQSAFIPGRLISDNVLAAYETLHSMHTRMYGKVGYMALKLDMSKAYDRVEWEFLEEVLRRMGFADRWIQLIMKCVSSVTYSVLINGNPVGSIRPTRGLRQGDPLSPYLFILCAEVLSFQLQKAERTGLLGGVPTSPRGLRLNHLFFADDSLLFCKTTIHD
jgi:hypothetical protein